MDAMFKYGYPNMVDHLPTEAITGGSVVIVGDTPMVAHRDMEANRLGALAAGGGVYEGLCDDAVAEGTDAFWDDDANKFSAAGYHFGTFLWSTDEADEKVRVLHQPKAIGAS